MMERLIEFEMSKAGGGRVWWRGIFPDGAKLKDGRSRQSSRGVGELI